MTTRYSSASWKRSQRKYTRLPIYHTMRSMLMSSRSMMSGRGRRCLGLMDRGCRGKDRAEDTSRDLLGSHSSVTGRPSTRHCAIRHVHVACYDSPVPLSNTPPVDDVMDELYNSHVYTVLCIMKPSFLHTSPILSLSCCGSGSD